MKAACRHALLVLIAASAAVPVSALAEDTAFFLIPHEVTLDMDHDGTPDRARIVPLDGVTAADLSIYLGAGDQKLDPAREPTFVRKDLTTDRLLLAFESKGKGSLVITYGCGGCRDDFTTTLTIVYRHGTFLVAGYRYDWETRTSAGSCEANLLTGKGELITVLNGKGRPFTGKFKPVKLADWSDDRRPKACNL